MSMSIITSPSEHPTEALSWNNGSTMFCPVLRYFRSRVSSSSHQEPLSYTFSMFPKFDKAESNKWLMKVIQELMAQHDSQLPVICPITCNDLQITAESVNRLDKSIVFLKLGCVIMTGKSESSEICLQK